jgi:hypothetical protein
MKDNIANKCKNVPNFNMEYHMLYMDSIKKIRVWKIKKCMKSYEGVLRGEKSFLPSPKEVLMANSHFAVR